MIKFYIFICILLFAGNVYAEDCSKDSVSYNKKGDTVKQQVKIGDYVVSRSNHNTLMITQANKLIYTDCDLNKEVHDESKYNDGIIEWDIHFKKADPARLVPSLPIIGTDITGDGVADLVIFYTYQGSTCCETVLIFELGKQFKKIAKVQGNTWPIEFKDVNHDKIPEVLIHDDSYRTWYVDFAFGSYGYAKPQLILSWNGQSYELRPDLMRKSPPSKAELNKEAKRISHYSKWMKKQELYKYAHVPLELLQYAMDLMYSGNEALGWEFARLAWSDKLPVDEVFLAEWKKNMESNPIWQAIVHNKRISSAEIQTAIETTNGD